MDRIWIIIGSILGFLSVALGAFGAHGLKQKLTANDMAIFETAVQYHMVHALALIGYGLLTASVPESPRWPGWCLTAGVLIFSGSLYFLVLTGIRKLGMITAIGGILFLIGWAGFAIAAWKMKSST